jgi:hypothetical protein
VINLHNHLEVVLPPRDDRDDPLLTTAANNALAPDIAVPDGVEATAENGNLTLTGMVDHGRQRAAAESAVTGLTGVCTSTTRSRCSTTPIRPTSPGTSARHSIATRCLRTTLRLRRTSAVTR